MWKRLAIIDNVFKGFRFMVHVLQLSRICLIFSKVRLKLSEQRRSEGEQIIAYRGYRVVSI